MEGDQVIFTAIGSTDTPSDVPYLNFAWDLNTNSDSDGDGNPANDRDMIGYSVQTNFVKDGSRTIRLMVNDGTETSTFDIEIRVDPAPQPMGVSKDSAGSHVRFMENNNLQYDLIVDTDLAVQNAYGVWQEKTNYGKTYMGTVRSTFVIEKDGVLSVANYNVRATGHVERLSKELGIATSKEE